MQRSSLDYDCSYLLTLAYTVLEELAMNVLRRADKVQITEGRGPHAEPVNSRIRALRAIVKPTRAGEQKARA